MSVRLKFNAVYCQREHLIYCKRCSTDCSNHNNGLYIKGILTLRTPYIPDDSRFRQVIPLRELFLPILITCERTYEILSNYRSLPKRIDKENTVPLLLM